MAAGPQQNSQSCKTAKPLKGVSLYENKARASVLPQMRQTFGVNVEQSKGVLPSLQSDEFPKFY